MAQHYSNPKRADDPHALPDIETFQLTATEVAEMDEELVYQYLKRFPLATMNSREREKMLDAMVKEDGITGGWFYWYCFPGCLPESTPFGPFESQAAALADARENAGDDGEDA